MKVAVGIAFHNRIEKLTRLLKSIKENKTYTIDTYVICDNIEDFNNSTKLIKKYNNSTLLNKEALYVVKKWNWFYKSLVNQDYIGYINLVDDVELYPNTIEKAIKCLLTNYPDTDGIVGFNQECPGHPEYTFQPTGQTLVGNKFLRRYNEEDIDYQVCCPYYQQWMQDVETFQFADKLGKFKFCKEATLKHFHPCFIKLELDETHNLIRGKMLREEKKIYIERQKVGLIWGESWKKLIL